MSDALNLLDTLFLELETPTTPMHVGGVLVFAGGDGRDSAARLADLLACPVTASPFDLRLAGGSRLGRHWRKADAVDLADHVATATAAAPGGDGELMALISRLHSVPIDRGRPMWQCYLIDGLDRDRFALYYKIHHACVDGITGIRRMQHALSRSPGDATAPVWAVPAPRRRSPTVPPPPPRRGELLRDKVGAGKELARTLAGMGWATLRRAAPEQIAPYTAPDTILNRPLGGARSVAWHRLPLDGVRAIAQASGATINEVAIAIVAAVVREILVDRGALPDRPLVAMVPVSLRAAGSADAAGNRVSSLLCNLATDVTDPAARLRAIMASSQAGKQLIRGMSRDAAAAYALVVAFPAVMAQLAGLIERCPLPFNIVISNVPGPAETLYQNGAALDAVYPVSLLFERQAINVTLISYQGSLDIGLVACQRTIPDLVRIAGRLGVAFDQLSHAVLG